MLRLLIFSYIISNVNGNEKNWWRFTEIYEVYISSFKDTNGDGLGDMKGITSKMDYFKDLQIDSIWISPFFESSKFDMGYDVSNYNKVDPEFGTLADFEELSKEAEKRGIKVFIDFVINHSSHKHIWFQKSIERIEPYDTYYIWKDPKGYDKNHRPIPPNNWMSLFGGSAWEWNENRGQF
ncbi:hypothetical protein V9T40_008076 [Parthenolecanium corni]|uniref:alpha-glucosidase n=1 Tax=Parthenolecanium corni TaxID=536013 RepID=A0AAN9TRC7_9HEMI